MADNPLPIDRPAPEGTKRQRAAYAFLWANSSRIAKLAVQNELVENRQTRRARERAERER